MEWERFGQDKLVSDKSIPIKSWRILDDSGSWRRYRVCTVWEFSAIRFSSKPALARLVKDEQKRIGVVITGMHGGLVKVGKSLGTFQSIFTAFNTINKKARQFLTSEINCDFFEEGSLVLGREIGDIPT